MQLSQSNVSLFYLSYSSADWESEEKPSIGMDNFFVQHTVLPIRCDLTPWPEWTAIYSFFSVTILIGSI